MHIDNRDALLACAKLVRESKRVLEATRTVLGYSRKYSEHLAAVDRAIKHTEKAIEALEYGL